MKRKSILDGLLKEKEAKEMKIVVQRTEHLEKQMEEMEKENPSLRTQLLEKREWLGKKMIEVDSAITTLDRIGEQATKDLVEHFIYLSKHPKEREQFEKELKHLIECVCDCGNEESHG